MWNASGIRRLATEINGESLKASPVKHGLRNVRGRLGGLDFPALLRRADMRVDAQSRICPHGTADSLAESRSGHDFRTSESHSH